MCYVYTCNTKNANIGNNIFSITMRPIAMDRVQTLEGDKVYLMGVALL